MRPLNCTIGDAFRYHRQTLTDDEIQVALDQYEELADAIGYNDIDLTNAQEEIQILKEFKEDNEDTIEEAEAALKFVADIKRVYEDRFGRILDTPLDTLVQWIDEDLKRVPDSDE